jgi:ABC-type antimicrobial peptide transport system permease subunit
MQSELAEVLAPVAPVPGERIVFAADDALSRLTATRRFLAALMSVFGIAGVLLGAAGVYAVMASCVAQQTREIGVRLALGASPSQILRGVLTLAGRHLLAGLVLGLPIAWWLSRGFASMLFQVTPADVSVYIGVGGLIVLMGSLAAFVPARRAGSIDPIISLRR